MFLMTGHILIAEKPEHFATNTNVLKAPANSMSWINSINSFCNTAEIRLPGIYRERHKYASLPTRLKLKTGMAIKIECGYNSRNYTRFSGFIVANNVVDNKMEIKCEGYSYQLRKKEFLKTYYNPFLRDILEDLIEGTDIILSREIPEIKLSGTIAFKRGNRGIDVLEYLKDKCVLTVYFNHNELYVGLKYSKPGKEVIYQIGWNVINAKSLLYKEQQEPFSVIIGKRDKTGIQKIIKAGKGKVEKEIKVASISDTVWLEKIANDKLRDNNPGSYSGSFETFLEPFASPFDTAIIRDKQFPEREGKYFVDSVKGSFSEKGGRQTIAISVRLN